MDFQEANFYKKEIDDTKNAVVIENFFIVTSEIRPPDFDLEKHNREISERLKDFDYKDFLNE